MYSESLRLNCEPASPIVALPEPDGPRPTKALLAFTDPPPLRFKTPAPLTATSRFAVIFHLLPEPPIDAVPVADARAPTVPLLLVTTPPLLTSRVPLTSRPTSIAPPTFNFDPASATLANP